MRSGSESCSEPLFAIDRWAQQSDLQNIINRLLTDLIAAHPHNVMAFIHQWSAPPSMLGTVTKRNSHGVRMLQPQEHEKEEKSRLVCSDKVRSLGYDIFSCSLGSFRGAQQGDGENGAKSLQMDESCAQQLKCMYKDAKDSPYKFLITREECDVYIHRERLASLSSSDFSVCLGRGNYGFVVPAIPKFVSGGSSAYEEGKKSGSGSVSGQTQNGCRDSDGITDSVEPQGVIAIKIGRVQGAWSVNEVTCLNLVKTLRQQLEQEVEMLQDKIEEHQHRWKTAAPLQQAQQDVLSEDDAEVNRLEAELRDRQASLDEARHVVSLVSDVMYDVDRHALLLPFKYYPSSLGECIRRRREQSPNPIPACCSPTGAASPDRDNAVSPPLFSVREVQHVARSLCRALHFLHTKCSICHLDVKVDNILLSSPWPWDAEEAFPLVVLSDLGLAQPINSSVVQLGDFSTMAPEVYWACSHVEGLKCERHRISVFLPSSDMWSVGCVLLHMANSLEYGAWDPVDMFAAIEENYVSPALQHPQLWPMEMNDFIIRCFERDPKRRMETGTALAHPFMVWS